MKLTQLYSNAVIHTVLPVDTVSARAVEGQFYDTVPPIPSYNDVSQPSMVNLHVPTGNCIQPTIANKAYPVELSLSLNRCDDLLPSSDEQIKVDEDSTTKRPVAIRPTTTIQLKNPCSYQC